MGQVKVCISFRDPCKEGLRGDNLRSEPRWERLALEACINNPEVEEIYTLSCEWHSGSSITPKYKGRVNNRISKECIFLAQDWKTSDIQAYDFKGIIVHIFIGPWLEEKETIKELVGRKKILLAMGHPDLYENQLDLTTGQMNNHLGNFITSDKFIYLPLPWIPKSEFKDCFQNSDLLYSSRILHLSALIENKCIQWAMEKLIIDPSLNLKILSGWEPREAKDYDPENQISYKLPKEINEFFWEKKELEKYTSIKDRVHIYYGLSWEQTLYIYSKTKLLISHAQHYGGPPMESSIYGVPFVGTTNRGALSKCEKYLHSPSIDEAIALYERLLVDNNFYQDIARSYNEYAVSTYSFDAFNQALNNIVKTRFQD